MAALTFIISLISYFFSGYVFMSVWNWFPHRIFGVVELEYTESLGLLLVVLFFKNMNLNYKKNKNKEEKEERDLIHSVARFLFLWLILGVGVVIHAFAF